MPPRKFVKAELYQRDRRCSRRERHPDDFRVSITNGMGAEVYPISSFTWLLIPSQIKTQRRRKRSPISLAWMLTTGQKDCEPLSYAQLRRLLSPKSRNRSRLIK